MLNPPQAKGRLSRDSCQPAKAVAHQYLYGFGTLMKVFPHGLDNRVKVREQHPKAVWYKREYQKLSKQQSNISCHDQFQPPVVVWSISYELAKGHLCPA